MSQKRHGGGAGSSSEERRQKTPKLQSVVWQVVCMNRIEKFLEPLIRRVVKEEVEGALAKHLAYMKRHSGKQIYPSSSSTILELQFRSELSRPIFTGSRIGGEDGSVLKIELVDVSTEKVVTSGPTSSVKVELVVLEGDFESDGQGNWTSEQFRDNIVKERDGRRPLLVGDVVLELHEGIGVVGEISFTDNSSWTRSRKFRLGAKAVDDHLNGGMRIREALTEAFVVKDHRGELYKKHHPPSLTDEVWRLEKIGKDGSFHKRLSNENIHTVKDFLTLLCIDASRLKNILGSGMSTKMWEVTVDHARTCTVGNQAHAYFPNGEEQPGVVFDILGDLKGAVNGQRYIPITELSDSEKAEGQASMRTAFEHWEDVLSFELGVVTSDTPHASPISLPSSSQLFPEYFFGNITHKTSPYNYANLTFSSDINSYLEILDNNEQGNQACSSEDSVQFLDHASLHEDSQADLGTIVSSFIKSTARGKAIAGWGTLVYLFRWRFSIRRMLASKRSKDYGKSR